MTDVYVARLDSAASSVLAATLLGGKCRDVATDIALAPDGSIWVAGESYSDPLPSVDPLSAPPPANAAKPFVAHLDAALSRLLFSSHLDIGNEPRIAVDPDGAVYVAGNTRNNELRAPFREGGRLWKISPGPPADFSLRRVMNAFSRSSAPVSPGEIVALAVDGLKPAEEIDLGLAPRPTAPFELAGVSVRFNGAAAPVLAVRTNEIVAVTPAALAGQVGAVVQVSSGPARSNALHVEVVERNLALFDQVRNEDGSLNSPENPARAGSLVTCFFTGAGVPDSPPPDGAIAADEAWRVSFPFPIEVRFGPYGPSVSVSELISLPGFVAGLYQARVRVPVPAGTYPVYVFPSTPYASQVSISVRAP